MALKSYLLLITVCALLSASAVTGRRLQAGSSCLTYPVVGTQQKKCYDNEKEVTCPAAGADFYGQDGQLKGTKARYAISKDNLTVKDKVTRLTWTRSADINGDGQITAADKLAPAAALAHCADLAAQGYAGKSSWRLPSVKELYSLINFQGTDPSPDSKTTSGLVPFLTQPAFTFAWGDTAAGERVIDAQYASSTAYVADTTKVFGTNFADGRIKGYDSTKPSGQAFTFFVLCVYGNKQYGQNRYREEGGTVIDDATGLMWDQSDSGKGMVWKDALAYAQQANAQNYKGYSDWRVPSVKELHSITDYSRSPDTTDSPALDPIFSATQITNERGEKDWGFYWSSTTHVQDRTDQATATRASYVSAGRCLGYMSGPPSGPPDGPPDGGPPGMKAQDTTAAAPQAGWVDVHGAGCQRSDPKTGDPAAYPHGLGPQGDAIRIYNYVRLVRTAQQC